MGRSALSSQIPKLKVILFNDRWEKITAKEIEIEKELESERESVREAHMQND